MGADIRIDGHTAVVVGPRPADRRTGHGHRPARVGLSRTCRTRRFEGTTTINRIYHLDRGYEAIEIKLGALGASVERIR